MASPTRVVLLTGAAEELGAAVAAAAFDAGAKVAAVAARPWQVDRLSEQLGTERALPGLVPHGDAQAAAGFVKGAQDALGPITDVVCASVRIVAARAGEEPGGDLEELLDVNLRANTTVVRAALPSLRRRAAGRLALAAWTDDLSRASATCRASLAAVDAFAVALRDDLSSAGVAVARIGATASAAQWLSQEWR